MQDLRQERVMALAVQIADILAAHPNPHEADTACDIAKSLIAMRAKFSSYWQISTELEPE